MAKSDMRMMEWWVNQCVNEYVLVTAAYGPIQIPGTPTLVLSLGLDEVRAAWFVSIQILKFAHPVLVLYE